jgi:hypothetical protein
MKTDTLDIRWDINGKFYVKYERSDIERVEHIPTPNKMGFYHFHRKIGPKKAFSELRQYLIDDANAKISRLQKYIDDLKNFEPNWIFVIAQARAVALSRVKKRKK